MHFFLRTSIFGEFRLEAIQRAVRHPLWKHYIPVLRALLLVDQSSCQLILVSKVKEVDDAEFGFHLDLRLCLACLPLLCLLLQNGPVQNLRYLTHAVITVSDFRGEIQEGEAARRRRGYFWQVVWVILRQPWLL